MKYDCCFEKGNNWFRYRTGGILIHDNKMLFVKSAIGDYYYMIGGGVHLGETSEACIEREVFEETGLNARVDHLAVVCENFFKGFGGNIDGLDCHTIEFYYYMKILDDDLNLCKNRTDAGEELVWLPIEEIEESKIKPEFIKEYISEIISEGQMIHVIEERDRQICHGYKELTEYLDTTQQLVGAIALGYADENPTQRPRKKMEDIVEYRLQIDNFQLYKHISYKLLR